MLYSEVYSLNVGTFFWIYSYFISSAIFIILDIHWYKHNNSWPELDMHVADFLMNVKYVTADGKQK